MTLIDIVKIDNVIIHLISMKDAITKIRTYGNIDKEFKPFFDLFLLDAMGNKKYTNIDQLSEKKVEVCPPIIVDCCTK